jgi:hypothetical protein
VLTTFVRRASAAVLATTLVFGAALLGAAPANAAITPPAPVAGAPASASGFTEFNGLLYLAGVAPGEFYSTLFSFDGTTFTQIPGSPVGVGELHVLGGQLLVEAIEDIDALPSYSYRLFSYNGSAITQVPGVLTTPNDFVSIGDVAYFQASVADVWQVWQYDGTTASVVAGTDVEPSHLSSYDGKLYFDGDTDPTPATSETLFSYDPATPLVAAAPVPGAPAGATQLVAYNGLAYYGAAGILYSFDGALAFTPITIAPATDPFGLTVFDDALYFTAGDGSDTNVYHYAPGVTTKVPGAITETLSYVEYNGGLYYLGFADGLPAMNVIRDGVLGVVPGSPEYTFGMTVFEGKLYFSGDSTEASNIMYVLESSADPELPNPEPSTPAPADVLEPDDAEPGDVVEATAADPTLAATGSAPWLPGLVALALLTAGAAVVVGARARRA